MFYSYYGKLYLSVQPLYEYLCRVIVLHFIFENGAWIDDWLKT